MSKPDISVVVCTYQRPENLRRVLASIAGQKGVSGSVEVVVADDGSQDDTRTVVEQFRRSVRFPVHFVTHPHGGFCPGRCRNEGVAASRGDYLLLLDGDCLIAPDHLRIQLERRKPGVVRIGDHIRLSQAESARITEAMAYRGEYLPRVPKLDRLTMLQRAAKATLYSSLRHRTKPRLVSNNVGIARSDYMRVNGFDENFVGWGCEDDDFGLRLRRAGLRLETILWWTCSYHLWHPPVSTMPLRWSDGPNVAYLKRGFHLSRCGNGVEKRRPSEVRLHLAGEPTDDVLRRVVPNGFTVSSATEAHPEVELLFAPTAQRFSGRAECKVLVVADPAAPMQPHYADAHLVLADAEWPHVPAERLFRLGELESALRYVLYNRRQSPIAAPHFLGRRRGAQRTQPDSP